MSSSKLLYEQKAAMFLTNMAAWQAGLAEQAVPMPGVHIQLIGLNS